MTVPGQPADPEGESSMKVTLLYFDDCPNWNQTHQLLVDMQPEFGFDLELMLVETPEEAERLAFRGSPTVLVDGADPFAHPSAPVGLSCRVYRTDRGFIGSPTELMLRTALASRALGDEG